MELRDLIVLKRREKGFSQRSLAAALRVSPSAVAQWETGDTVPTNENMAALKELVGIEAGIVISPGSPYVGELVEDPDELALLKFWRGLSEAKRLAVFDLLSIGAPVARKAV